MLSMFELKPSDMASDADQNDSDGVQVRKTVAVQPRTCNNICFGLWQTLGCFPVEDYHACENFLLSLGHDLDVSMHTSTQEYTLKLVVGGSEFYDTVCGYKTIEYRTAPAVIHILVTKPVRSVILYHAYSKTHDRPYIHKVLERCVIVKEGVHIMYPRVEVQSDTVTYCLKLGKTLDYFNPHTNEPFSWKPGKRTKRKI
jgi:hypothetical protein